MPRAAFHNLGCKVNAYETEAMEQQLRERGYEIVPFDEEADVYVINTCSVTNIADRKSRQMLHRAKKRNPQALVAAVGCYVQVASQELAKDPSVDIIIGNNRKGELADILEEYGRTRQQAVRLEDIGRVQDCEPLRLKNRGEHTRAFIRVQDGCNQFCSYCIIPYARGRVRSRSAEDVAEEVRGLAAQGCREVVLTGIHLSSYGVEHMKEGPVRGGDWDGRQLLELIQQVHGIPGIERIRLGSLEPRIITEAFVRALGGLPKLCPHFHLSMQSGSDGVLKRMNRKYDTAEFYAVCERLRRHFPRCALTTDLITGFPGETEEEFRETLDFIRKCAFASMHVFPYSRRPGTKADALPGQLTHAVKNERAREAIAAAREMKLAYLAGCVGLTESVLFETESGGLSFGHGRDYTEIRVEGIGLRGLVKNVKILAVDGEMLVGAVV